MKSKTTRTSKNPRSPTKKSEPPKRPPERKKFREWLTPEYEPFADLDRHWDSPED